MNDDHKNTLIDINYKLAVRAERERLIALLREKRAIRDSILGVGFVLYTEHGAIDISEKELAGEQEN